VDNIQTQHERAVGNDLIAKINRERGTKYVFNRRGDPVPDLIYRDGNLKIGIEVVTCYYDDNDAKFKWQNARNLPEAPKRWGGGLDFDSALIRNINRAIERKCKVKAYGTNCLLAVAISTSLTTFNEMKDLIPQIEIPQKHQFEGIYLIGDFGVNNVSNVIHAVLRLFPD